MDLFSDLPEPEKTDTLSSRLEEFSPSDSRIDQGDLNHRKRVVVTSKPPTKGEKRKHSREPDQSQKRQSRECFQLKGYMAERKGERDEMQDAHVIIDNYTPEVKTLDPTISRLSYFAVFDGHSGARASRFASRHLHVNLADKFPKGDMQAVEHDIKKCFLESFKKTDEDFLKQATKTKPSWKDGSTAVVVLAIENTLYISNLGDSKAIMCRYNEASKKYVPLSLTKDHSPTLYEERMRIQKAGGHVRDGRVMGILEVSRSLGDGPYKLHGVTCVPDVKRCQLSSQDRFILLACDGLWKRFSNEEAIMFVNKILEDETVEATETKSEEDVKFEIACHRLASEAVRKLSGDNVTVLLVNISHNS